MGIIKHQEAGSAQGDERKIQRGFQGLVEQLKDQDPAVRRWAVRDLALYPEAAPILVNALQHETVSIVREAVFTSLVTIGNVPAVEGLLSCLRSEEAFLRNEAIDVLKSLPDILDPFIETLLHDTDSDIRIFAINILESLKHPKIEDWLLEVIANDPHVNVCTTAVDVLNEAGSERSIPALDALAARFPEEAFVQFSVDVAKRRIQGV